MTYNVFGGTLNPAQSNPIQIIDNLLARYFNHIDNFWSAVQH